MSNVIHADFGREFILKASFHVESEVLYRDDQVVLVRFRCGVNGDMTTTHFLAHKGGRVEVIDA